MSQTEIRLTDEDRVELAALIRAADEAAEGDSNDEEIEALRSAMEFACSILGVTT